MEPLTKIELKDCTWLGVLTLAWAVAGELLNLADNPQGQRLIFGERELARRATRQSSRTR